MDKKTLFFIAFVLGAAAGSVATFKYAERFYENRCKEETQSIRDAFHRAEEELKIKAMENNNKQEPEAKPNTIEKTSIDYKGDYKDRVDSLGYHDISNSTKPGDVFDYVESTEPYVISKDEYGSIPNYELETCRYYADGVLADEEDYQMSTDFNIGLENVPYLDDDFPTYIRNDDIKTDYEVFKDWRNYSDIVEERYKNEPSIEVDI